MAHTDSAKRKHDQAIPLADFVLKQSIKVDSPKHKQDDGRFVFWGVVSSTDLPA